LVLDHRFGSAAVRLSGGGWNLVLFSSRESSLRKFCNHINLLRENP
jgi:hypothetical protein